MGSTAAAMRQVLPGAEAVAMSLRISEIPPVWKDIYVGIYHIYMTYILYDVNRERFESASPVR